MLITFQIILFVLMLFGLLFLIGDTDKDNKVHYTSVVLASIVAELVCFILV